MKRAWSEGQKAVFRLGAARDPYHLIYGVPDSGKTSAAIGAFVLWSLSFTQELFGFVTRDYKQAHKVIVREVAQFCTETRIPFRLGKGRNRNSLFIGGNEYMLFSANNVSQASAIQSYSMAGMFVDEVVNVPEPIVEQIEERVRAVERAKLWMTANPGHPAHWFKREFVDRAESKGMTLMELHFDDNPTVTEAFKQRMAASQGGLYQRRFLGRWAAVHGEIYKRYEHPAAAPPMREATAWYVSVDPAETGTSHALLIGEFEGAWWICDEWVYNGSQQMLTRQEQAREIARWLRGFGIESPALVICDYPNGDLSEQLASMLNCHVMPAIKRDPFDGIELTQYALSQGYLRLSHKVPKLLTEMGNYVWDEKAANQGIDRPLKLRDHGCDAMRYFVEWLAESRRGKIRVEYAQAA